MYCEKCGAAIPEGTAACPKCAERREKLTGNVFQFHYRTGMSTRSVTEIDHVITFQNDGLTITGQKSLTVFRKRSKPAHTRTVKYADIQSVEEKTGLAPVEIPIIVLGALILLACLADGDLLYSAICLLFCGLSVAWAIRTMVVIHLRSGEKIRIPYSGGKTISEEFMDNIRTVLM